MSFPESLPEMPKVNRRKREGIEALVQREMDRKRQRASTQPPLNAEDWVVPPGGLRLVGMIKTEIEARDQFGAVRATAYWWDLPDAAEDGDYVFHPELEKCWVYQNGTWLEYAKETTPPIPANSFDGFGSTYMTAYSSGGLPTSGNWPGDLRAEDAEGVEEAERTV